MYPHRPATRSFSISGQMNHAFPLPFGQRSCIDCPLQKGLHRSSIPIKQVSDANVEQTDQTSKTYHNNVQTRNQIRIDVEKVHESIKLVLDLWRYERGEVKPSLRI